MLGMFVFLVGTVFTLRFFCVFIMSCVSNILANYFVGDNYPSYRFFLGTTTYLLTRLSLLPNI